MKPTFWVFLGVALFTGFQAPACSTQFIACGDSDDCLSAAGQGGAAEDAGSAGVANTAAGGEAGGVDVPAVLFGPCAKSGAIACQGPASAQRLSCNGSKWVAGLTCPGGELCDSDSGNCAKVVVECSAAAPGQVVCRGDKPVTCGPDLATADEAPPCAGTCKAGVCLPPACGDTKIETGEECDDGNTVSGDGCGPTCVWEAVAISAGGDTSCALSGGGDVKCWGDNSLGALGQGDMQNRGDESGEMGVHLRPIDLGKGRKAKAIASGAHENCALLDDNTIKCWGGNASGQLGTGDQNNLGDEPHEMGDALNPVAFGIGRSATAVSIEGSHACAILDDGVLKCWGAGEFGQLGSDDERNRFTPDPAFVINLGPGRTAKSVRAGSGLTCALLDDASAKCWGHNMFGDLSVGPEIAGSDSSVGNMPGEMARLPSLNFNGRKVKSISPAAVSLCALLEDGSVRCWGANFQGQLGTQSTAGEGLTPSQLAVLPAVNLGSERTAKSLTTGSQHVCAVLDNGSVKCWGANASGQLGVGRTDSRGDGPEEMGDYLLAVPLGGRAARQVSAGTSHSCALLDNGTVKCWGQNDKGQLGVGTNVNRGDSGDILGVVLSAVELAF